MNSKYVFTVVLCTFLFFSSLAQQTSKPIYKLDWKKDGAITLGAIGFATGSYFIDQQHEVITPMEISALNRLDVKRFNRSAIDNYSLSASNTSDVLLFGSFLAPGLLMLSKDVRSQGLTIGAMYLETISFTAGLTALTKSATQRVRPLAYNPDVPLEDKTVSSTTHAFFSGHVSQVASASFFAAKVFSDLHPDSSLKPFIWGAAIAAPAITGYLRYKAGKHFTSDVLVGYAVGAAIGYLVPALHKKTMDSDLSIIGAEGGIGMRYRF